MEETAHPHVGAHGPKDFPPIAGLLDRVPDDKGHDAPLVIDPPNDRRQLDVIPLVPLQVIHYRHNPPISVAAAAPALPKTATQNDRICQRRATADCSSRS